MRRMRRRVILSLAIAAVLLIPAIYLSLDRCLTILNFGIPQRGTRVFIQGYGGATLTSDDLGIISNTASAMIIGGTAKITGIAGIHDIICKATSESGTNFTLTIRSGEYYQDGMTSASVTPLPVAADIAPGDIWLNRTIKADSEKGSVEGRIGTPKLFENHAITKFDVSEAGDKPITLTFRNMQQAVLTAKLYNIDETARAFDYTINRFANLAYVNPTTFNQLSHAAGIQDNYSHVELDVYFESLSDLTAITRTLKNEMWYDVSFPEQRYYEYYLLIKITYTVIVIACMALSIKLAVNRFVHEENLRIYGTKHIPSAR